MKNSLLKFICISILSFLLSSCSQTRQITIPSTIPADMQQLIKSTKVDAVNYSFHPNPKADLCKYQHTYGGLTVNNEININNALEPLLTELIQSKFAKTSNSSQNIIDVKIVNVHSDESNATLLLVLEATVTHKNIKNTKQLSYSMSFPYNSSDQPAAIHSFLMKFIIGIDKFLDNEFDVQ